VNTKLDHGSNVLTASLRNLIDINNTDKQTMGKLEEQTRILESGISKLATSEQHIDRSDNIIRNMIRRVFTNKLVLFAIILLLGCINSFLIYIKVKHKFIG
jgi:vesicle transport through interaction with t-SNAREs protein 1